MNITDFQKPTKHPFNMLEGMNLKHTYECESVMALILRKCIDTGSFAPVQTKHSHPALVNAGLVNETGPKRYELTRKGKGYLYAYYGIEQEEPNEKQE